MCRVPHQPALLLPLAAPVAGRPGLGPGRPQLPAGPVTAAAVGLAGGPDRGGAALDRLGPDRIGALLAIPASTVHRAIGRLGLGRPGPEPVVVLRYEHTEPGSLVHLDTKKLGRIVGGPGHRATGDRRDHRRGVGWEVLHVAIDDATRLVYAEILPDERAVTAARFLVRALRWFRDQGVLVRRVITDNGSAYRSRRFGAVLRRLGIRHTRTRPYRPQTNGKDVHLCQAASSARSALNSVPARSIVQSTRSWVRASAMIAW